MGAPLPARGLGPIAHLTSSQFETAPCPTLAVMFPRSRITMVVRMTAAAFRKWLERMGISGAEAARLLGVHVNMITRYRREGAPYKVALACSALWHRQTAWDEE